MLGHDLKECTSPDTNEMRGKLYGEWLKVGARVRQDGVSGRHSQSRRNPQPQREQGSAQGKSINQDQVPPSVESSSAMKPDIEKIGSQPDTFLASDVDSPIISELQIRSQNRIKTSVDAPQLDDTNVPVTQTSHSIPNSGEELFSVPISYGASEKQIQALVPCPRDQRKNTPPKLTWTRLLRTPTIACMDISVGQKTVGAK